jgi:hypothetical protein
MPPVQEMKTLKKQLKGNFRNKIITVTEMKMSLIMGSLRLAKDRIS